MNSLFDYNKATQIVSYLIKLNKTNLNYTKAIKLIYIADRESLKNNRLPISLDKYVSMDNGPVVSNIYDLIRGTIKNDYWNSHIAKEGYDLRLIKSADINLLSKDEIETLEYIDEEFKSYDYRDLISYCHKQFKEWEDPEGSSKPIDLKYLLTKIGKRSEEIEEIEEDLSYLLTLQNVLSVSA